MMMKYAIPMQFRNPLVIEIPDDTKPWDRMCVAVETAVKNKISLQGVILQGVDLRDTNLQGVIFSPPDDPSWSPIRDDLTRVLDQAQPEIPALLAALRAGRVNGRVYNDGECGCGIGTIAIARGVDPYTLPFRNASSPIERLFLAISRGDTPDTKPIAKIVEAWIVAYQQEHGLKE